MRFKLVAIDIDGTLLKIGGRIGKRTANALSSATRAGYQVVLCTGRRYSSALPVVRDLHISLNLVLNSGALVKELSTHRTIHRRSIPPALFDALISYLTQRELFPCVCLDTYPLPDMVVITDARGSAEYLHYLQRTKNFRISPNLDDIPRDKIVALGLIGPFGAMRDVMSGLKLEFRGAISCQIITFGKAGHYYDCLEILRGGTSKWSALMHIAEQHGIKPDEIVAIGNDMNDIEMIRKAGLGLAVANAKQEVKDAARFVIGSCDEEGVADFIEDLLAREKR